MVKKSIPVIFVVLIMIQILVGQSRVNEWKHYTSTLNFTDMAENDGLVYFASGGGIVLFDPAGKQFQTFSAESGLSRINLEAIGKDGRGNFWVGSGSPVGEINIFDPEKNTVIKVFNSSTWNQELTAVTDFAYSENRMFVVCQINTDWGLLEFDTNRNYAYKDFYFNFPHTFEKIEALSIAGGQIYITTSTNLMCADLSMADLKNPDSWKLVYSDINITNVVEFDDNLLFGVDNDIYAYDGNQAELFLENLSGDINHLQVDEGKLFAVTKGGLYNVDSEGNHDQVATEVLMQSLQTADVIIGRPQKNGLYLIDDSKSTGYIPNTSLSNTNTAVCVLSDSRIVTGSKFGFSILHNQGWKNIVRNNDRENRFNTDFDWNYFAADTIHFAPTGRIYSLIERSDGYLFASLYGANIEHGRKGALVKFDPDNLQDYTLFDTTNGYLATSEGHGGSDHFFGIGRMALDERENIWICNQYADNDNVIAVIKNDDTWTHFSVPESDYKLDYYPTCIAFDDYGRVWIGQEEAGIQILDYNNTLDDKSDDTWYKLTTMQGIGSNKIYDMAFDHNGVLFLTTAAGIQEAEVNADFSSGRYFTRIDQNPKYSNISFQKENVVKVDGQNNKWFTTSNSGVLVYTWDNLWLNNYEGYTIDNSGLLSNEVLDIDFLEEDGLVVMSTTKGISVLKSQFSVTRESFDELNIFPMPFRIPAGKNLVIEGLLPASEIKIMTLDGTFVRKLESKAGEITGTQGFWDGRDQNGKLVSSGVYLCMVYTEEGESAVGKIAVVRE